MSLIVLPIKAKKEEGRFDLFDTILRCVNDSKITIENGDVLVISSKYISNSQGRLVDSQNITASKKAASLAKKFHMESKIAEIILRESDVIFGGVAGFVITSADNILAPNAGIDKSNVKKGKVVLYPNEPYLIAEQLRRKFFLELSVHVGVIIIDSRLMPSRVGTTGIAIACAGIEPVSDRRAEKDLDGNPLKVTFQAVADNLASIANHKMGEGSESQPFAIIKNSGAKITDRKISKNEMAISHDQCVYIRGLKSNSSAKIL
jgi:coenzyme F420-0:L-glutamate ligase